MAAQTAAASDQVLISTSKTRRDYRLSLALLAAGAGRYSMDALFSGRGKEPSGSS
jgi:hypothetical protein